MARPHDLRVEPDGGAEARPPAAEQRPGQMRMPHPADFVKREGGKLKEADAGGGKRQRGSAGGRSNDANKGIGTGEQKRLARAKAWKAKADPGT